METNFPNINPRSKLSLELQEGQDGVMPMIATAIEGVCERTGSIITNLKY